MVNRALYSRKEGDHHHRKRLNVGKEPDLFREVAVI